MWGMNFKCGDEFIRRDFIGRGEFIRRDPIRKTGNKFYIEGYMC